jgi:predicted GNAT family N-acyltransferase
MKINITLNNWNIQKEAACSIREQVFIAEQHIPMEMKSDPMDEQSLHAVATDEAGTPIGTGRLLPDGHIGRVAILAHARGNRVGTQLLQRLMHSAKERGDKRVVLSANSQVEGFYLSLGFKAISKEYVEAGIKHIDMEYCF